PRPAPRPRRPGAPHRRHAPEGRRLPDAGIGTGPPPLRQLLPRRRGPRPIARSGRPLRRPPHPVAPPVGGRAAGPQGGDHRPRADAGRRHACRPGLGHRRRLHPLLHRAADRHRRPGHHPRRGRHTGRGAARLLPPAAAAGRGHSCGGGHACRLARRAGPGPGRPAHRPVPRGGLSGHHRIAGGGRPRGARGSRRPSRAGLPRPPVPGFALMRPLVAQLRAEVTMIFTNGETVFLTLGIPVVFLLFFSAVHVLPTGTDHPVDFLVPGILALAIMSTAMTALGIGTGFERGYGVLKRLGSTPLGRPRLLTAKIIAVLAVELLQAVVLVAVGYALGWNPGGPGGAGALVGAAVLVMVLGTVAFGGIGLALAGTL